MNNLLKILYIFLLSTIVLATEFDFQKIRRKLQQLNDQQLTHLSYDDIVQSFYQLQQEYPNYIKVYDAAEQFSDDDALPQTRCFKSQEQKRACKFIYAQMTNFSDPHHTNFTQSFFSGNFHGDEVVGPNIVTYLAKYVLQKPYLELLTRNFIVLLPFGNPSGYYNNKREEQQFDKNSNYYQQIDMNRDFPYDQSNTHCFKTAGARVINYIWKQHIFTASITFHGGMTAIGWPWGSTNHVTSRKGDYSPDQNAFYALGKRMSQIADFQSSQYPQYPYDTLTNAIYEVGGSFEDWSYAASWEKQFNINAPIPKCTGVPQSEQDLSDNITRSLTYLIETTDHKIPNQNTYGTWLQIESSKNGIGHVSRNVRLTLDFINNLSPSYQIELEKFKNNTLHLQWKVSGCESVEYTKIFVREKNQTSDISNQNIKSRYNSPKLLSEDGYVEIKTIQSYPGNIKNSESQQHYLLKFKNNIERTFDIALVSVCDKKWINQQSVASPTLEPQTHFVRSRLNENYVTENNGYFINSNKYIISSYGSFQFNKIQDSEVDLSEDSDEQDKNSNQNEDQNNEKDKEQDKDNKPEEKDEKNDSSDEKPDTKDEKSNENNKNTDIKSQQLNDNKEESDRNSGQDIYIYVILGIIIISIIGFCFLHKKFYRITQIEFEQLSDEEMQARNKESQSTEIIDLSNTNK